MTKSAATAVVHALAATRNRRVKTEKEIHDAGFACGVAYAAAYLARDRREETEAAYLLGESGMTVADFRKAKVDGYDMRVISRLYRTEPYLQSATRREKP